MKVSIDLHVPSKLELRNILISKLGENRKSYLHLSLFPDDP
jgi:hypothetical protein